VTTEGTHIQAPAAAGALHGLATFAQLVTPGAAGFEIAAVHIEDRPRDLMLDVARR